MTEKPILMSGPMVRAILEDRKNMTRRVIKPQPDSTVQSEPFWNVGGYRLKLGASNPLPVPYEVGMRLWVRETFALCESRRDDGNPAPIYAATSVLCHEVKWKPSIFMPRWASRITLEITGVKVERVQEISEADALAEGVNAEWHEDFSYGSAADREHEISGYTPEKSCTKAFERLWDSLNEKRGFGWNVNPFCWCLSFRVVKGDK